MLYYQIENQAILSNFFIIYLFSRLYQALFGYFYALH